MMAAVGVDLNVNATYSQHPALKSVYGNIQPVIGGKLFSFHCIGKCLKGSPYRISRRIHKIACRISSG